MRQEAHERVSDIVYTEALNDGVVDEVVAVTVEAARFKGQPLDGSLTTTEWQAVVTSNALRYLLMDELRLGDPGKGFEGEATIRVKWRRPAGRDHEEAVFPAI